MALAAAFAFVLDGALASDHHIGEASEAGIYHGAHVHFHLPVQGLAEAADHQHSPIGNDADLAAAHDHGSTPGPTSGADGGSSCHFASSYIGVMLPCPSLQAELLRLPVDLARPPRDSSDGFEPEGLREPPRPTSIA